MRDLSAVVGGGTKKDRICWPVLSYAVCELLDQSSQLAFAQVGISIAKIL